MALTAEILDLFGGELAELWPHRTPQVAVFYSLSVRIRRPVAASAASRPALSRAFRLGLRGWR